jgi:methylated-DNA-[protein]-cysteine S-methyltransferase
MKNPSKNPIEYTQVASPMGDVLLAASERGLVGLWFIGQKHFPDTQTWVSTPNNPVLQNAAKQFLAYLQDQQNSFDLPLDLSAGTAFQQSVWQALLRIPRGQTIGYGALAQQIAKPQAARAVGAAVGRNPVSVVVPCHRVVGSSGALTGYAGGLARKTALLKLESALP